MCTNKLNPSIKSSDHHPPHFAWITRWRSFAIVLPVFLVAVAAPNVWAQTQLIPLDSKYNLVFPLPTLLYPAKFVCGFEENISAFQGSIPPTAGLYRNFEPGHYSTVLNILNASRRPKTVRVMAAVKDVDPNPIVATITLDAFQTDRFGCPEILATLGGGGGELVEGFVHISSSVDDLDVEAVYSFTSKDRFSNGGVLIAGPGGQIEFPNNDFEIGGAGVGGLGLGASIDVVKIDPRTVK